METIQKYVNGLKLGKMQQHQNMAVAPLMAKNSKLDYILFDEALKNGLMVSETGTVQQLHLTNKTGKEILILQGEYVLGGKQNRMIARNVFLEKGYDGPVPVNCVQHHRWTPDSHATQRFMSSAKMASKGICYAAARGQQEVWDQVECLMADAGVRSSTSDLNEVYEGKQGELSDYLKNFEYVNGCVGVAAIIQKGDKKVFAADIFDQSKSMKGHFNKLIESYAMDALSGGADVKGKAKEQITDFIAMLNDCRFIEQKPISLGRDFSIDGKIQGAALEYNGKSLYVTFSSRPEQIKQRNAGLELRARRSGDSFGGGGIRYGGSDYRTGGFGRTLFE
jgi:hypothetical protein